MPKLHQRGDHGGDSGDVVDADLRQSQRVRGEVHDRSAGGPDRGQVLGQLLVELRIVEARTGEDHRRGAHLAQQPDVRVLALRHPAPRST